MNYVRIAQYSQVASAILFVIVMVWIWIKFIQPAVLAAQQNANARIAEAERRRDDAKAALAALHADIETAKEDASRIKERAAAQARAEREAIVREARESGERSLQNAQGELGRARAAARVTYRDELLAHALQLARASAQSRVDAAGNARLVANFVASLESSDAHG